MEWKKNSIDKELTYATKYEEENKKLLAIIDGLNEAFQEERSKWEGELRERDERLRKQAEEREELVTKSVESEHRIDQLVREHTREI